MSFSEREQSYVWQVEDSSAGQRVDKFVAMRGEWSRSLVQSWIAEKRVTVNERAVKANYRLQRGDRVTLRVPPPEEMTVTPENIPLDIVYEDEDVIVVNKPRGMVVHPAPGHHSGTLVHALLAHCGDLSGINGVYRPGIVHRIDKDTSGLIMAPKTILPTHPSPHNCPPTQWSGLTRPSSTDMWPTSGERWMPRLGEIRINAKKWRWSAKTGNGRSPTSSSERN